MGRHQSPRPCLTPASTQATKCCHFYGNGNTSEYCTDQAQKGFLFRQRIRYRCSACGYILKEAHSEHLYDPIMNLDYGTPPERHVAEENMLKVIEHSDLSHAWKNFVSSKIAELADYGIIYCDMATPYRYPKRSIEGRMNIIALKDITTPRIAMLMHAVLWRTTHANCGEAEINLTYRLTDWPGHPLTAVATAPSTAMLDSDSSTTSSSSSSSS